MREGNTHQSSLKESLIGIIGFAAGFGVLQELREASHAKDVGAPGEGCLLDADPSLSLALNTAFGWNSCSPVLRVVPGKQKGKD